MAVKGIQFVIDDRGDATGVLIDLKRHGKLWSDIFDRMLIESRRNEPRIAWSKAKSKLRRRRGMS